MNRVKLCTKCKQEKPFSEFNKKKDGIWGLDCHCKQCRKAKKIGGRVLMGGIEIGQFGGCRGGFKTIISNTLKRNENQERNSSILKEVSLRNYDVYAKIVELHAQSEIDLNTITPYELQSWINVLSFSDSEDKRIMELYNKEQPKQKQKQKRPPVKYTALGKPKRR